MQAVIAVRALASVRCYSRNVFPYVRDMRMMATASGPHQARPDTSLRDVLARLGVLVRFGAAAYVTQVYIMNSTMVRIERCCLFDVSYGCHGTFGLHASIRECGL